LLTYSQIAGVILSKLDAEGSDRYLPEQDIIPAINSAVSRVQSAAGWALANRKGSEEMLRDMTRTAVFQTSPQGWILLDDPALSHTMANVMAIYPHPDTEQDQLILPNPASAYRDDLTFIGPTVPCHRVTVEMTPVIRDNGSMRGNEVMANNPKRRTWAYYLNQGRAYLLPKSQAESIIAAVVYIEKYARMVDTNGTVNLPEYMLEQVAAWALVYLAWKQDTQGQGVGNAAGQDAAALFQFSVN